MKGPATIDIGRNPWDPDFWDLYVNGHRRIVAESRAVVDNVAEELRRHGGPDITTECGELAAAMLRGMR